MEEKLMATYSVFLPSYTVGVDAYKAVPEVCCVFGSKAVVICGKHEEKATEELLQDVAGSSIKILACLWYGGNSTNENIEKLKADKRVQEADMVFAVGGGRVCDLAKILGQQTGKPYFTFPTLASNCAPATSAAVLYKADGSIQEYYFCGSPARHLFINTRIIAASPERLLWAGIGDALSKEYEVELATRGLNLSHTPSLGSKMAFVCAEPLLHYGAKALEDCRNKVVSYELEQVILDIIMSTGLVSNFTIGGKGKYYYNSNLAHCFYNGSTVIPACSEHHLHGEIVAFGVLVLFATIGNTAMLEKISKFNLELGLPVCLADIDLQESDVDTIVNVASIVMDWKAVSQPITKEQYKKGILEADRYGRQLKNPGSENVG